MTRASARTPRMRNAPALAPHLIDVAPQLVIVRLADAVLVAVAHALDHAHPALLAAPGKEPSNCFHAETFALQILELSTRCRDVLHDYAVAVECELDARLDDDLF